MRSCWQNSGTLLEHISTIETVRDLDLLRQLVGDEKLNYLGYSYGTQIGATYAELFPASTGRLVLDAAVNITDNEDVIQAMGFDLALGNFAAWCAEQDCPLGSIEAGGAGRDHRAVRRRWTPTRSTVEDADADPEPRPSPAVAAFLYGGERGLAEPAQLRSRRP